ncbi:MAG TPA: hypothetical protein VN030_15425 [Cellvibrio sp.]|nr:hypothetical protein [Cellvibrio sp.]
MMFAKLIFWISLLLMSVSTACSGPVDSSNSRKAIEDFYKSYLNAYGNPELESPELRYSKALQSEMEENYRVCQNYAASLCGWNAEGDPYLLAIEPDEALSFENTQTKIAEISPDLIQVRLNPNPSSKPDDHFNISIITYKVIREDGAWVVDDIFYGEELMSVRENIKTENAGYIANPDVGSLANPLPVAD